MNSELTYDIVKEAYDELVELTNVLGLDVEAVEEDLDSEVEKLIEERQAARKNKDFAKADEIRDKLKDMGIELLDTREGVKWKRI
jgi:cysteinyl-tRNA synthetase